MSKKTVSGTTRQATRTVSEKKQKKEKKEKPQRLTEDEKIAKYGNNFKNKELNYKINFKAKTDKQLEYYDNILNNQITFGIGEPGTGKSFVGLSAALRLLAEDNHYKKILIVVPTVEAGAMDIGFLKGDKGQKIQPYLDADFYTLSKTLSLSGNDGDKVMEKLVEGGYIIGDCVSFMRGKTLDDYIVLFSEAENFSKQEMFLLLSRIGNSKYIFNGDNRQLDRKDITKSKQKNGLEYAEEKLQDVEDIAFTHFGREDIVRNPLIGKIMDKWFEDGY